MRLRFWRHLEENLGRSKRQEKRFRKSCWTCPTSWRERPLLLLQTQRHYSALQPQGISFTSSHPMLSCLWVTPNLVTLLLPLPLIWQTPTIQPSALSMDISSSRKASQTPRTFSAPPTPAVLPYVVTVCFLDSPPDRDLHSQEPGSDSSGLQRDPTSPS